MKPSPKLLKTFRDLGVADIELSADGHLLKVRYSEVVQMATVAEQPMLSTPDDDDEEDAEKRKAARIKRMQQNAESLLYGSPVGQLGEQS